ncbi:MAG: ABC transporter transmembrane domain-containing protein, partial [Nitrospinales bacterium]
MSLGMFKAYWQAILGYRRRAIILVLLIAVAGLFEGSALLTLGPIFQAGSSQNFQESRFFELYRSLGLDADNYLVFSIGAFVVLGFISAAITLAVGIFTVRFETQHEKSLRERLTRALIRMKWTEFVSLGLGDISKAILMESYYISFGTKNLLMGVGYLIVCFFFSIAALFISTKMTFLTLIFASILGLGYKYVGNKAYRYSKEMSEWGTIIGNQISEIFGNLKFFRAIGSSRDILDKAQSLYHRYQRTFYLGHIFQPVMRFTFEAGGVCLVGFLLGYSFFIAKESLAQVVVFLVIFYRRVPRMMSANHWFHVARTYQPWFQGWNERLEFISSKTEDNRGRKEPRFKNSLEIRKLFYQYNKEGGDVLREISFTIKKGDCIA